MYLSIFERKKENCICSFLLFVASFFLSGFRLGRLLFNAAVYGCSFGRMILFLDARVVFSVSRNDTGCRAQYFLFAIKRTVFNHSQTVLSDLP